jgi:uncharacterized membrane protein
MTNVQTVSRGADGCSHWVLEGPAGTTVTWDAELTKRERNRELAWKTCPGSAVRHAGRVLLEEAGDGTRVTVHLACNPMVGAAGKAVGNAAGREPKRQLEDDTVNIRVDDGHPVLTWQSG